MSVREAVRDPRGYLVRSAGMYRALLFDPEGFYEEYVGSRGIIFEVLLVVVIGLVGAVGNFLTRDRIYTAFSEADFVINNDVNFELWSKVLGPLVGIVLLWLGLTVLLFAVGWAYSAIGQFYTLLKRSAWALVPLLFANLIHSIAIAFAAFQVEDTDVEGMELARAPVEQANEMWNVAATEVYVVATVLLGVVFVVWAGYIATFAVRDVRELNTSEAYRVAAVPTVIYAAYLIYEGVTALL